MSKDVAKRLETPSIISHTLGAAEQRRLSRLSARYLEKPYDTIPCVLFDGENDSLHWVELRHTGLNDGVGLHEWGANERDRFRERRSGVRKPAGQILDFVEAYGALNDEARSSKVGVLTNIERLLVSRSARDALGIDIVDEQVVSYYPRDEVAKGLTHVVEDLKTRRANVKDVYHAEDRENYVAQLPKRRLPAKKHHLKAPVSLSDLAKGKSTPAPSRQPRRRRSPSRPDRTSVIPSSCVLNIPAPRINKIYNELTQLNVETYPNAGAVLLRVFLELFAGGASVALALLYEDYVDGIHINDLDASVFAFWQAVLTDTDALCSRIRETPVTMDEWERQRAVRADPSAKPIDLAFATFFLNRTNRSGILDGGVIGGRQQTGNWKLDARYNKDQLIKRIQKAARFRNRITLTRLDAADLLLDWLDTDQDGFVYLDPPVLRKG